MMAMMTMTTMMMMMNKCVYGRWQCLEFRIFLSRSFHGWWSQWWFWYIQVLDAKDMGSLPTSDAKWHCVHVAYLLSPDPRDMAHSSDKANMDPLDRHAMENLVQKMFVSQVMLHTEDQDSEEARLIHKLWQEYGYFSSKQGFLKPNHIWITVESGDCLALVWHKNYSHHTRRYWVN